MHRVFLASCAGACPPTPRYPGRSVLAPPVGELLASGIPDGRELAVITSAKRIRIVGTGPRPRLRLAGNWDDRPIEGIELAHGVEQALDKLLREQVRRARANGCSWTEIGRALGTTKQSAWERFSGED